jgi:hypothetical protein
LFVGSDAIGLDEVVQDALRFSAPRSLAASAAARSARINDVATVNHCSLIGD